jgi:NTE family protein
MGTEPADRDPMLDAPVQAIPGDDPRKKPEEGAALCLSGGGYRAMLFHLGALWRLYETNLLKSIKRISSVSGRSITAGVLGLN